MRYWVIDVETSIKNRGPGAVGDMPASPYHVSNNIVLFGERQANTNTLYRGISKVPTSLLAAQHEHVLLIGHNLAFDLKYIKKTWPEVWDSVKHNIYIWYRWIPNAQSPELKIS